MSLLVDKNRLREELTTDFTDLHGFLFRNDFK